MMWQRSSDVVRASQDLVLEGKCQRWDVTGKDAKNLKMIAKNCIKGKFY